MDAASLNLKITTEGMDQAQRGMEGLSNTAGMLEAAFAKLVAAFAAYKAADWVKDVALLAARYETLGIAMNTAGLNMGYTSVQMAALQSSMEKTGISMNAARQSLTMMAVAQMDMSRSTELARVAQNTAIVANMNSSEAFETLTRSIQTGMAVTAHHMGLMVNYDQAEKRLADSLGKTKEQLTDREKIQARMNEALRVGAGFEGLYEASMTTAGKQLKSMERYVENLEAKMGSLFGPALSAGVTFFTNTLKELNDWMDKVSKNGSLKKLADGLGAFTGGALDAAVAPIKLMIEYSEQLKVATLAVGVAAMFAYGNQWVPALASAIAPTLRMLTLTVALELSTIRYAAGAGLASLATAGWSAAMTAVLSPMGLTTIALGALYLATKGLREETEKLNAENDRKEKFMTNVQDPVMNMRGEAIRLRKQREALLSDGGAPGAATRQFQIDELVKGVSKGKEGEFTPEWMENARRYAAQTVDNRKALEDTKTAIEKEAAARAEARKAAEEYSKMITGVNQSLAAERILLEQGERAAFAYSLTIKGMKDADKAAELAKWDYNKSLKDQAEKDAWIDRLNHDIRSGDKARNSNAFAGRQNDLQEEAAAWDAMLQAAYPWLGEAQQIAQTQELLNIALAKGAISLEGYKKRTDDLRVAELRLRAESGDTWAIIGYTVTQNADKATDAMTRWMDNTDGLGRSWRTLGDTVRNVIADMLVQMQKAIIKQQLMQPLMDWASNGSNWTSLFGGSASSGSSSGSGVGATGAGMGALFSGLSSFAVGTDYVPYDMVAKIHQGEAIIPASQNRGGGSTVNAPVNISVKVESNGQVSSEASGAAAAELARRIAQEVVGKWAMEQSRPNGVLARA